MLERALTQRIGSASLAEMAWNLSFVFDRSLLSWFRLKFHALVIGHTRICMFEATSPIQPFGTPHSKPALRLTLRLFELAVPFEVFLKTHLIGLMKEHASLDVLAAVPFEALIV